jgi:hypothetical protein
MSTPPTYFYPITSDLRFILHSRSESRNGFEGAIDRAICDPPQKLLITRSLKMLAVQMFFWIMAFSSLLMLLSDCDTVVLKVALNYGVWIAVVRFCACNMGFQKANVP